jgi:hypothetical protein
MTLIFPSANPHQFDQSRNAWALRAEFEYHRGRFQAHVRTDGLGSARLRS